MLTIASKFLLKHYMLGMIHLRFNYKFRVKARQNLKILANTSTADQLTGFREKCTLYKCLCEGTKMFISPSLFSLYVTQKQPTTIHAALDRLIA